MGKREAEVDSKTVEIIVKVNDFFKDYDKTALWLRTKNPMFGHLTPLLLISIGRAHKVIQFIDDAKEGNLP